MAGLNFYTQTIINSNLDRDSKKPLFKVVSLNEDTQVPEHVQIKRDFTFFKSDERGKVLSIYKKAGYEAEMCLAKIAFNKLGESSLADKLQPAEKESKTFCRLDVYLGVEGAEPFIYSTPWVAKGMPFWIEFTVNKGDDASTIAKNVKDAIVKNHVFQCDKDLINVELDGFNVILTGADEYQRFKNIKIVRYIPNADAEEIVAEMVDAEAPKQTGIQLVKRGFNSFGTYSQIVKDLRLPTAANWQPYHIRQAETPIVGAIYNQYILNYEAPATNEGLGAVGLRLNSVTTHVFWVKQDTELIKAFEGVLTPALVSDFKGEAKVSMEMLQTKVSPDKSVSNK